MLASMADKVTVSYNELKGKDKHPEAMTIELSEFIDVKGWKALGNQLGEKDRIQKIKLVKEESAAEASADAEPDDAVHTGDTLEWDVEPKEPPKDTLF